MRKGTCEASSWAFVCTDHVHHVAPYMVTTGAAASTEVQVPIVFCSRAQKKGKCRPRQQRAAENVMPTHNMGGLRTEAAACRKEMHRAIAHRDLEAMRAAIHDLYVDDESPLREMGDVRRMETYAPIVEAAIVARIHAPETLLCREMLLNLKHTHAKFGVPEEEYEAILAQLRRLDEGVDAHDVDWCADTCLHTRVKPFRHERLFSREPPPKSDLEGAEPADASPE